MITISSWHPEFTLGNAKGWSQPHRAWNDGEERPLWWRWRWRRRRRCYRDSATFDNWTYYPFTNFFMKSTFLCKSYHPDSAESISECCPIMSTIAHGHGKGLKIRMHPKFMRYAEISQGYDQPHWRAQHWNPRLPCLLQPCEEKISRSGAHQSPHTLLRPDTNMYVSRIQKIISRMRSGLSVKTQKVGAISNFGEDIWPQIIIAKQEI